MEDDAPVLRNPSCPRCGYDLRGTLETWKDACPLEGRCSECGLEFEWGRLFVEGNLPWLFEHHWRRRPVRTALATSARIFRPWRLWREMAMTDVFRPRPALTLAVLVSLTLVYAVSSLNSVIAGWDLLVGGPAGAPGTRGAGGFRTGIALTTRWQTVLYLLRGVQRDASEFLTASVPYLVVWIAFTVLAFRCLPDTLRAGRVLPHHIRRIGMYAAPWTIGAGILGWLLVHQLWGWLAPAMGRVRTVNSLYYVSGLAITAMAALALTTWFALATRSYLRLPHAFAVALLLTLLGWAATDCLFILLDLGNTVAGIVWMNWRIQHPR